jgi:acyl-CoA thioesterase-1
MIRFLTAWLVLTVVACGSQQSPPPIDPPPSAQPEVADSRPPILFVGTSITAGLGLDPADAFPALIQLKIDSAGLDYSVTNAGVSGETSAGALRRTDWLFRQDTPAVLVLETGANDGLRGQDPDSLEANIRAILLRASELRPKPRLVLVGMEAPPNLGQNYTTRFREVYRRVAGETGAAFVPFLLEGVAGVDSLNQGDGIHPTREGHHVIAETLWSVLRPVLLER